MKRLMLIILLAVALLPAWAQTPETEEQKVWEEFVEGSETFGTLQALAEEIKQQLREQQPSMSDSVMQQVSDTIQTVIGQYVHKVIIPAYQRHFTLEEAKEINAFFRTPVGSKLRRTEIQMTEEMTGQLDNFGTELDNRLMEVFKKAKDKK
ncbi:MAG: DUF2059 domain-containing protein [Prevotellaceae bacterium]|nr:DUF2059 domain-containing protein [Prevotellaceae bacterium]MDY3856534.1 DUF2059 domain-containing protein [Bacteroidaceae bacterium]